MLSSDSFCVSDDSCGQHRKLVESVEGLKNIEDPEELRGFAQEVVFEYEKPRMQYSDSDGSEEYGSWDDIRYLP